MGTKHTERCVSANRFGEGYECRCVERKMLDVSKEPHWLYKDFNVLYRALLRLVQQVEGAGIDQMALPAAKAQLERLKPAFTDTEEVRKAMRGE